MTAKVWYTTGLSVTGEAIAMMRSDPAANGLSFMASHVDADNQVCHAVDEFVQESRDLSDANYTDWLLKTALQHEVALIVVQRRSDAVWAVRSMFTSHGIRLQIAATPNVRALLNDKIAFQDDIRSSRIDINGHPHCAFSTLEEFDVAWASMSKNTSAGQGLCAKPARGMFGSGFRRIEPGLDDMAQIISTDPQAGFHISLGAYRSALAATRSSVPHLLMPYLSGLEQSVDFVAKRGRLLYAVCRTKMRDRQQLATTGLSIEMARVLAAHYELDGMCNMQTREDGKGQKSVLEINPRMSGGMAMACLAGSNLPLASVLSALEHDLSGIQEPVSGASVKTHSLARLIHH